MSKIFFENLLRVDPMLDQESELVPKVYDECPTIRRVAENYYLTSPNLHFVSKFDLTVAFTNDNSPKRTILMTSFFISK